MNSETGLAVSPEIELEELPDDVDFTIPQLYDKVAELEEVIIVIGAHDEARVRRNLSSLKAKQNQKLKDNNLEPDRSTLEFERVPANAEEGIPEGCIKLKVMLKGQTLVRVKKWIRLTD